MNINFSSQVNNNNTNCSFGQWKRVAINNFDNIVSRAYSLRNIMEANPKARACFYTPNEGGFNVTKSLFGLIEYIQENPEAREKGERVIDVYVNGKFHRKLFNALKKCLMAPDADTARNISLEATKKFQING